MFSQYPKTSFLKRLRRYRDDARGSMSVEMVLVVPILLWAYFAMVIFFDAYRARMEAQAAALNVADLISRQTGTITADYLDGMNDVYDFLTTRAQDTRLRISSVMWDIDLQQPVIAWSHGTRGLPSLLELSDMLMNLGFLGPEGGEPDANGLPDGPGFGNFVNMIPREDLAQRIPAVLPGEALILVEAFTIWESPIRSWMGMNFLNDTRLSPIAVTRPRFSPFIRSEFDNNVFPESPPEYLPPVGEPEGPAPEPEPEPEPEEPVSTTATIVDTDFSDGVPAGWSSTTVNGSGANAFLGPFGQQTWANPVTYAVNLGETSESAVIEFDLVVIDSWDSFSTQWAHPEGEFLTILVNGTSIALDPFQVDPNVMMALDRRTVASRTEGRFTTTMQLIQSGTNLYGSSWNDQIWRVRIEVENPATQFTLGFAGRLDEDISNESFGFRNFRIIAERGEHGPAHFVPNAANLLGTDPLTRFASYSGCPDRHIPAVNMTMRNSNLTEPLRMRRMAGGMNNFSGCGIPGASRFIRASPTMVLHYTNDTSDVNGNRLRIRTEDNNNGRTCDSTILIRDPFGQWSFNDDLSPFGWNGGINMGHAATGEYHIWVGTYSSGSCQTDLRFERY